MASVSRSHRYPRGFYAFISTQFLGAFNDNAFKMMLVLLALAAAGEGNGEADIHIATISAVFTLPFLLFASWAGTLSDRAAKHKVMFAAKVIEIIVMLLALAGLLFKIYPLLLFCLFLMGTQSTLFGPAKYGILPEVLPNRDLSRGNGVLAAATFAAILLGTGFGGQIYGWSESAPLLGGLCFIAVAVAGAVCAVFIPHTSAAAPGKKLSVNPFAGVWGTIRRHWRDPNLAAPIWGVAAFWTMAIFLYMTLLLYAGSLVGIYVGAIGTALVKELYIRLVTSILILLCCVSRVLAVPAYLKTLDLMQLSPATARWLEIGSKIFLFGSGIVATSLIIFFTFRAHFRNRKLARQYHMPEARAEST